MRSSSKDATQLLIDWSQGDKEALAQLMPLVYDELHRLAASYLHRHRPDNTLQTTALVHEAYLQLVDQANVNWQSRAQFFGIAAKLMRQIIVDHARSHQAAKRGGATPKLSLDEAPELSDERAAGFLALDEALTGLAAVDAQKSRIVELRFFGGLTIEETAQIIGVSTATVKREWSVAKTWLYREIRNAGFRI